MSQALLISAARFIRWNGAPRKPIEPLLAQVAASLSELEADAGPQRLTIVEATDDIRDLAEELGDLVWDSEGTTTRDELRSQAVAIMVAAARFYRDACGER